MLVVLKLSYVDRQCDWGVFYVQCHAKDLYTVCSSCFGLTFLIFSWYQDQCKQVAVVCDLMQADEHSIWHTVHIILYTSYNCMTAFWSHFYTPQCHEYALDQCRCLQVPNLNLKRWKMYTCTCSPLTLHNNSYIFFTVSHTFYYDYNVLSPPYSFPHTQVFSSTIIGKERECITSIAISNKNITFTIKLTWYVTHNIYYKYNKVNDRL